MLPSLLPAGMSDDDAQTRATSSITMQVASASAPTPPYSSGTCGAWKSVATSASCAACGKTRVSSTSAAYGAILSSATARTASRSASWSSESRNRSKSGSCAVPYRRVYHADEDQDPGERGPGDEKRGDGGERQQRAALLEQGSQVHAGAHAEQGRAERRDLHVPDPAERPGWDGAGAAQQRRSRGSRARTAGPAAAAPRRSSRPAR